MFKKNKPQTDRTKDKEERFRKIATRRVKEIIDKMRLLRNCANKANYSYNDAQAKKIINTLEEEWKIVKHEFSKHKSEKKEFSI